MGLLRAGIRKGDISIYIRTWIIQQLFGSLFIDYLLILRGGASFPINFRITFAYSGSLITAEFASADTIFAVGDHYGIAHLRVVSLPTACVLVT